MIPVKNARQLDGMRQSGCILGSVLAQIREAIRPGATTKELDLLARSRIAEAGATPSFLGYMGFPAAVCISVNEQVIHGIPSRRKLAEGDIVGIDLGVNWRGFFSDAAITVPVGKIRPEISRLLAVTKECLALGIEKALAGNRIKDISRAVFDHATRAGYGVVHQYCGHGVGLSPHEDPQIPNYAGPGFNSRIREGMTFAIEPMINLGVGDIEVLEDGWTVVTADGKWSAHFEHTVIVTFDGPEIITGMPE